MKGLRQLHYGVIVITYKCG